MYFFGIYVLYGIFCFSSLPKSTLNVLPSESLKTFSIFCKVCCKRESVISTSCPRSSSKLVNLKKKITNGNGPLTL